MQLLLFIPLFASLISGTLQFKGVDWSSTLLSEGNGQTYYGLDGQQQPLEQIFSSNGVNTVRQRIWIDPGNGNYDLNYNLKLAQRARATGLDLFLDFHYSSTWADPSHQDTPATWSGLGLEDLAAAVQNYTTSTLDALADAGTAPSIVSVGNEIRAGMLWPTGALGDGSGAYNLATLLHAASAGVRASSIGSQARIMLHLDNGWKGETQEWWYSTVLAAGPLSSADFDIQGVSYYPFYDSSATLTALTSSLSALRAKYGKDIIVAETDWPSSCDHPTFAFPADVQDIPFSSAGQSEWMRRVADVVEGVGGSGLFYWEPAWTSNGALGSSCESNLMFDWDGKAQESLAVFQEI